MYDICNMALSLTLEAATGEEEKHKPKFIYLMIDEASQLYFII